MEVFTFNKSFLERLHELESILTTSTMSLEKIKEEWVSFVEIGIETAGIQALWAIPRDVCRKFKIKYPTEVFGTIDAVLFSELQAIFTVIAVQDESIHLPESHVVNLDQLFVTKNQENPSLNADVTADIIDRLRFFNNYILMPWDNETDEMDFQKQLLDRLNLFFDLKCKNINKKVSSYIRHLLNEGKTVQKELENLDNTVDETEAMAEDDDDDSLLSKYFNLYSFDLKMKIITYFKMIFR